MNKEIQDKLKVCFLHASSMSFCVLVCIALCNNMTLNMGHLIGAFAGAFISQLVLPDKKE